MQEGRAGEKIEKIIHFVILESSLFFKFRWKMSLSKVTKRKGFIIISVKGTHLFFYLKK